MGREESNEAGISSLRKNEEVIGGRRKVWAAASLCSRFGLSGFLGQDQRQSRRFRANRLLPSVTLRFSTPPVSAGRFGMELGKSGALISES